MKHALNITPVHKRLNFVMVVAAFLLLGVFLLQPVQAGRAMTQAATASTPGRANTLWIHWDSSAVTNAMLAKEAARRKVIVLNAWEHNYIPTLKAANPNVMVLVYKDLSSTRDYACKNGVDNALLPTGVGYCDALKNHPKWFLTDNRGNRLKYGGYAGHWQMDIGNPGYQKTWLQNVQKELVANKWDGVWMDNALNACDQYHPGVCPAAYPTDATIQTAYKNMLSVTYPSLKSAGKKSIANMANARLHPGLWNSYLTHLDGGFDEWWLTFGTGQYLSEYGNPSRGWKANVDEITSAAASGKMAIVQAHTDLTDTKGFYFSLASYFLANDGNSVYAEIGATDDYGQPTPWRAAYDWNLGTPTEAMRAISHNVYRRAFTCGLVVVNANSSGSYRMRLGKTYLNESGARITSINLPATSGTILRLPNCKP